MNRASRILNISLGRSADDDIPLLPALAKFKPPTEKSTRQLRAIRTETSFTIVSASSSKATATEHSDFKISQSRQVSSNGTCRFISCQLMMSSKVSVSSKIFRM